MLGAHKSARTVKLWTAADSMAGQLQVRIAAGVSSLSSVVAQSSIGTQSSSACVTTSTVLRVPDRPVAVLRRRLCGLGSGPGRPRRTSGRLSVVVLNCEMVAWLIRVSRVGGATKTVRRGAALRSGGGVWPARRRAAAARRRMALLTVGGDLEPQPLHAPHRQVVGYPHAGDRAASFLTAVLMQPTAGHCSWPESPPRNRAPVALGGRRHTGGLREFWEPRRHCGSLVPRWFRAAARTRAAVALRRADASAA